MKRFGIFLAFIALFSMGPLRAQTGSAAVETVKAATSSNWQNWIFVGSLLLTAAGAILIIMINDGAESTAH